MSPDVRPNPDELSLREVVSRLASHAGSMLRFALVAGVVALIGTLFLADWYRPEAVVSIEQPRRREGNPLLPLDTLVQNHRRLLLSANLHAPIIARLAAEDHEFSRREFAGRIAVDVPRESNFLFIGFRDRDPALAARVSTMLAEELVQAADRFNGAEVERFLARYQRDAESARAEAAGAEERLAQFQSERQLDLLGERIAVAAARRSELEAEARGLALTLAQLAEDPAGQTLSAAEDRRAGLEASLMLATLESSRGGLLEQSTETRTALAQTRTDLAAARQRLAALEADLASQERVVRLRRAITDAPELQQAAARQSGRDVSDLLNLTLESESLNPAHTETLTQAITARALIAELEERQTQLNDRLTELTPAITATEDAIARARLALDRAARDVALADEEYRALLATSAAGLDTRRRLAEAEIASLTASIEAMRTAHLHGLAQERMLRQESELAHARLERFAQEQATARLSVLESLPTLALRSPATEPTEPLSKNRRVVILAAMTLGFALGLVRAYFEEF